MANTTLNNETVVAEEEVIMNTLTQKDIDAIANGETVVVDDMDMEVIDMGTTMTQEEVGAVAQEEVNMNETLTQEEINTIASGEVTITEEEITMMKEHVEKELKKVGKVEALVDRFKVTTNGCEFNIFIIPTVGYAVYVGDIDEDDEIEPSIISSIDKVVEYCNSIAEKVNNIKEEKDMADVKLTQVLKGKVEEIREDLANGSSNVVNDIKESLDNDAKTITSAFGMVTQSLSKVFDGGEISLFLHEYINTIRNNGIAGVFSGEKILVNRIHKLGEKYAANGKMDKLEDAIRFECGDNTQGLVGSLASLVAWTLIHAKSTAKKLLGGVVEDNDIIKKLVEGASAIIGVVKAGISIVFNIGIRVITFATTVVTKAVTMLWDAVKYIYNKIKSCIKKSDDNDNNEEVTA